MLPSELTTTDTDAESATATQWARVLALRSVLPEAIATVRVHQLSWKRDQSAPSLRLHGVLAVCHVGPLILRREFAVEESTVQEGVVRA